MLLDPGSWRYFGTVAGGGVRRRQARRQFMNARREASADGTSAFLRKLARNKFADPLISGTIDLSDRREGEEIVLRGLHFTGPFIADSAVFSRLIFEHCIFDGGLLLRHCRVRGDIALRSCRFSAGEDPSSAGALDLSGTRIAGSLTLAGAVSAGDCTLARIIVQGDLTASDLQARSLILDKARIRGEIRLEPRTGADSSDSFGMKLERRLEASGASCHALVLASVEAGDSAVFTGLQVAGDALFHKVQVKGDLIFLHLVCREVVRIHGRSVVQGTTTFAGARIGAQLDLSDSDYGEIIFNGAEIGSLMIGILGPVTCSGIYATDSVFQTYARLTRLIARAPTGIEDPEQSARALRKRLHLEEMGTILFRACRFGSLFSTWVVKRFGEEADGWQEDNFVIAEKAFLFTDCTVEGELCLTRLCVGAVSEWSGGVRLDRTRVGGAFLMSSPLTVSRRHDVAAAVRDKARSVVRSHGAMAPEFRAHMRTLSMLDFKATYADLTGLSLHACNSDDSDATDGCLIGDRMEIAGCMTTYACAPRQENAPPRERRAHAEIPGAMRLRGARIGELHLAAESFHDVDGTTAWRHGVVLELAEIGQLRVPPHLPEDNPHANGFPVPLDLSGMTVRNWNFDEDLDAESAADVDLYLDFLDNDEKLHREVYKSVAESLREVGRDEDAERILFTEESRAVWERHQSMAGGSGAWPPRPRAGRPGTAWLRRFRGRLPPWLRNRHPIEVADRWFLQYRRNPIRLLYMILGLFLFSVAFVSSRPANFQLSNQARLVLAGDSPGGGYSAGIDHVRAGQTLMPDPDHWGLWNSVWMTARYHVPIVPIMLEDEYVASNDARLDLGLPLFLEPANLPPAGRPPGEIWASAEDYFGLMSVLNWIMWPLLLTFALRRALRAE